MLVWIPFGVNILKEFDLIQRLIKEILRIFDHFQAHPFISSSVGIQIHTLPSCRKCSLRTSFVSTWIWDLSQHFRNFIPTSYNSPWDWIKILVFFKSRSIRLENNLAEGWSGRNRQVSDLQIKVSMFTINTKYLTLSPYFRSKNKLLMKSRRNG